MPRILRRSAAILILLGAWALVGSDRAPLPISLNQAMAARSVGGEAHDPPPHDLSSLRVFTKVILHVKDNYVDPKRIHPKEMMVQALEYVEKTVPEVLVEGTPESGKLKVNVNGKVKEFDI